MANLTRISGLIAAIAFVCILQGVAGEDYGKVTCMGKNKVPSAKLLGTFAKARCSLPTKFPMSDPDAGKITRCTFIFLKSFIHPNKFDITQHVKAMETIFPKKYHPGLKTAMANCFKNHSKGAKNDKEDPSGSSWAPIFHCFNAWFNDYLCQK